MRGGAEVMRKNFQIPRDEVTREPERQTDEIKDEMGGRSRFKPP